MYDDECTLFEWGATKLIAAKRKPQEDKLFSIKYGGI